MTAKIILDSINSHGDRLTTMEVTFHRFVLAEFNTHRAFSRNSASNRAIPVRKQLERVKNDLVFPVEYPAEKPGMQGGAHLDGVALELAQDLWKTARQNAIDEVEAYLDSTEDGESRLHKSVVNRILEPFMMHTVVVSSTEWENFFDQRCSPLAQPEIRYVAEKMREALRESEPRMLERFDWHTPYIQPDEFSELNVTDRIKVSTARCARVSYLTHDGVRDIDKDLELFDRLVSAEPPHWSPLEHVARPIAAPDDIAKGNFKGWEQLRHLW